MDHHRRWPPQWRSGPPPYDRSSYSSHDRASHQRYGYHYNNRQSYYDQRHHPPSEPRSQYWSSHVGGPPRMRPPLHYSYGRHVPRLAHDLESPRANLRGEHFFSNRSRAPSHVNADKSRHTRPPPPTMADVDSSSARGSGLSDGDELPSAIKEPNDAAAEQQQDKGVDDGSAGCTELQKRTTSEVANASGERADGDLGRETSSEDDEYFVCDEVLVEEDDDVETDPVDDSRVAGGESDTKVVKNEPKIDADLADEKPSTTNESVTKDVASEGDGEDLGNSAKSLIVVNVKQESGTAGREEAHSSKTVGSRLEGSPVQTGLLGSVMKKDLGEILRRSCRERKTNMRFSEDSITPASHGADERKAKSSSARVKPTTPSPAARGTGGRLLSEARAKAVPGKGLQKCNNRSSSEPPVQMDEDGCCGGTAAIEQVDQQHPHQADDYLVQEAIEGGKRLVIKKQDKARKSFGAGSDAVDVPASEAPTRVPGRVDRSKPNPFHSSIMKRNKKRFFRGSTYSLTPSRAHKKRRRMGVAEGDEGSDTASSVMTNSLDAGESSEQNSTVGDEQEEALYCSYLVGADEKPAVPSRNTAGSDDGDFLFTGKMLLKSEGEEETPPPPPTECQDGEEDVASFPVPDHENQPLLPPQRIGNWKRRSNDSCSSVNKYRRKSNGGAEGVWVSPLKIPSAQNGETKKVAAVTLHQPVHTLCTCRTLDGTHVAQEMSGKEFCQGIDCIDNRLIGCVNVASVQDLLRPATRVPFQALCEVHRQRLRLHQCCPGCGLFCTQGTFIQCRADPKRSIHHSHKDCLMVRDGKEMCPHCSEGSHLHEVCLELNAPRSPAFFHKQQPTRKEPGARMAFTRGNELSKTCDPTEEAPIRSYTIVESGKEISSAGLPLGPDRSQLEEILMNLSHEQPTSLRYNVKNMLSASRNGDVEKILHMLMLGFDPNMKFEEQDNCSPLHVAAANGHLVLAHVLVQASASLDSMDNALQTPLMFAIESGHVHISQYLIKAGAQLDARGEDGMTVLHLAAKAGQLEVCRLILDTGKVNVNIQDDGGWTSLVWAAEHRHLPVVKFLLERGSDPNLRDNEHNIALHWSCFAGSLEISEIFLNHGCDLNSANEHGDTPLHIAARQDKYECVMFVIISEQYHSKDFECDLPSRWTTLSILVPRLFLARNADVDCRNKEGETPLMCCPDPNSQTWLALSMSKHLKKISGNRMGRSERILHQDISRGKEQNPIQCVNGVDDEPAPSDFLYIRDNCETSLVNMDRSIASLQSCTCDDDCSSPNCTCGSMSLKCWYDKEGRLIDEFNLLDPPMIFECNRACRCWTTCHSRVLQHGMTCRLQLFRTKGKGWGVRALRDIPRGTFICEYVGEVISDLEADKREDDSYLFDLDNRDGETYCIDARRYGNISRFINHLCEPNLVPVKVFIDYQDLRFPRIAFFNSRPIRAYEELGFDYGDKFWIIKYKIFTCTCSSEKCKYSSETIHETLATYNRRLGEEQEDEASP